MSQIKKALERARAERLCQLPDEDVNDRNGLNDRQPETPAKHDVPICYTRTRVVDVPVKELLQKRIVAVDEGNPLSDQFKRLRTRLLKQTRARKWNTIQVTGFGGAEGKTLVAVNLAVSIAQDTRQTTLLVDLDFRRPSVASVLGLGPDTPGLKSYFYDGAALEDLFVNPGIAGLTVLTAGEKIPQSTELVGSPKMEKLIDELKHYYQDRYIILDTPGIGVCSDPLVISEYVDGVLLVARVDHTSQESIRSAMAHIHHKEKILGVVLNDVSSKAIGNGYY